MELKPIEDIKEIDALIIAVAHNEYKKLNIKTFKEKFKDKNNMVLIDIKGILNKEEVITEGYKFWRL